jgi:3-deoxy-manno-octulosonate cytidylyltransferase (CMP-KDO synthetase)
MIQRVLERCSEAKLPKAVVLCTDSEYLRGLAKSWGFPVLMTSDSCQSGSDRIASVSEKLMSFAWKSSKPILEKTIIINVQGDQPFIEPFAIDAMVKKFSDSSPCPSVVTPVYRLSSENIHNPNVVKVLLAQDGRAIYFSRTAIPHVRDVDPNNWHHNTIYWGHVGIYGYRGDVLNDWTLLPPSPLERLEKLEQLRLIEAGKIIMSFEMSGTFLSVDTLEQLEKARSMV